MNRSYASCVVLRVGGDEVEPSWVTHCLDLEPHRAVGRHEPMLGEHGDARTTPVESPLHPTGSWRRYPPVELAEQPLEEQLVYWVDLLASRREGLALLRADGLEPALSCFVETDAVASVVVEPELVEAVAELGLRIELSIFASPEGSAERSPLRFNIGELFED